MARFTPDPYWHRVTKAWTASYTPALAVRRGESLTFGKTDPETPGWQWATNSGGRGGWLPLVLIDGDHLTRDFDSTELTVTPGTRVLIIETLAGWHLCNTQTDQRGWLPATHIA